MMLNPLFEREFRGRWRTANAFWVLILPISLEVCVLYLLIQRFLGLLQGGDATVDQMQGLGRGLLAGWQIVGGLVLVPVALCIGATSILHEKDAGTLDQLLLSPLEPRGIIIGKLLSGAAYLLAFQVALLPVLFVAGSIVLLPPGLFCWKALTHFVLTFQALALGILGAVRGRQIAEAIGIAFSVWLSAFVSVFFTGSFVLILLRVIVLIAVRVLHWGWLAVLFAYAARYIVSFFGGFFGCYFVIPGVFVDSPSHLVIAMLGQLCAVYLLVRWTSLQLNHPEHLLVFFHYSSLLPILFSGQQRLTPEQTKVLAHRREEAAKNWAMLTVQMEPVKKPEKEARKNTHRLRLLPTRWLQNLNPVFWLDLQRCLSLRAPAPEAQVPLLLFIALGGSIVFALGMATIISLFQTLLTGTKADLAYMADGFASFRVVLCYFALGCGPLFGAMGFVIERRSKMLHELRLTLLTAREMWWGKFGARFIIPVVGCLPCLAVIGFFADNMPGGGLWRTTLESALMVALVASASILTCLVLSLHSRSELMAVMWCLGVIGGIGSLVWPLGSRVHPWLAVFSPEHAVQEGPWLWLFLGIYALVAGIMGSYVWWRLRREGFA